MSDWADEAVDEIVVPSGATTGQRIVIDGVAGTITSYDNTNSPYVVIDENGIWVYGAGGPPYYLQIRRDPSSPITPRVEFNPNSGGAAGTVRAAFDVQRGHVVELVSPAESGYIQSLLILASSSPLGGATWGKLNVDTMRFRSADDTKNFAMITATSVALNNVQYLDQASGSVSGLVNCTYSGGWGTRSGFAGLAAERVASPRNSVQITGMISNAGTRTSGMTIGKLGDPSQYPVTAQGFQLGNDGTAAPVLGVVNPDGTIQVYSTSVPTNLQFNNVFRIDR